MLRLLGVVEETEGKPEVNMRALSLALSIPPPYVSVIQSYEWRIRGASNP